MARSMSDMKPHLLPEWAPHAALWVGWPRLLEEWGGNLEGPRKDISGFIRAASDYVPIRVAVGSDEAEATAGGAGGGCAGGCRIPTGDIWVRRSEEGRVGEESRSRGSPAHLKKKKKEY